MAFFRDYSSETTNHREMEDKNVGHTVNRAHSPIDIDLNSSDNDFEMKMDGQYQNYGDPDNNRLSNDVAVNDGLDMLPSTSHTYERRTGGVGKWGSTFLQGNQRPESRNISHSEHESRSGSEYINDEGSDGVEDYEVQKDMEKIPAEEMLSDEYYEQDGDDQNDSLQYRNSKPTTFSSRPQSRIPMTTKLISRSRKRAYDDDDVYAEEDDEEDEDVADGDDPADADFDPEYGDIDGPATNKDGDWEVEESDEDVESEGEPENSDDDDDDSYFKKKPRGGLRGRSGRNANACKKPLVVPARRRKSRVSEDEFSALDSDADSDEGFRARRKSHLSKSSKESRKNETRTSSRSIRKVSYVESDDGEEADEEKNKKAHKEEFEEEDADAIERVLWHQPRGMAEEAMRNNKSTEPVLLSHLFDTEPDWNEMEFLIKWKGQSHLHCQWKSLIELQNLSGFKKVLNYMKRVKEDVRFRMSVSREEIEVHDVSKEMDLDLFKQNCQVERIIAHRISKDSFDDAISEYLVKWQGLSYAEATWEKEVVIESARDAINEYKAREAALAVQGKTVDAQRRKSRGSLRKLDEQPEWLRGGKLRDYQLEGLNFLVISWRNDTNVILADEMGLGKTVQSVSMLGFLQNSQQIYGPFLVVVPLSTLSNWAKEFRKWLPNMNVIVYVGTRGSREVCQQYEFYNDKSTGRAIKFDALLTTYEVVLKDKAVLSKIKWNYLMVDEAHRLKNSEASLYTALSEFSTKNKVLITGTPLQNSVEELWALLHFLDPDKFSNKDVFVQNYKNLSSFNETELSNLHMELRPHILRRVIKDVEKSLPPKIERILRVEMSPLQKQYYKWILERNFHDLNKGVRGNQVSLLNIVVELKKCCNHPFLFESADHGYGGEFNDGSKLERTILSSGKLVILDKLLMRLHETKHRVLIFSQMVRMLDILAEYLSLRGFQYQRLDGSTKAELRHQAMEHFNAPGSDDFCFLLSTRAGGLGINLATADTVIIFDSDWNPQNDLQAMSRAHRIGQQEVVNIYRFVTSKSVEEDILERAKKKMVLDHLVIQKLNAEGKLEKKEAKKGVGFDKNELSAILRFGAEELFKEEKNEEESKRRLLSMDIDEILERAEKVEDKEAETDQGNELLSQFKVANFCNAEDDASFWSRWIKPGSITHAEDALAPRGARFNKSYVEPMQADGTNKRKKRDSPLLKVNAKRRRGESVHLVPMIDGACAQVRDWSCGNLSKRDATRFAKAVMKFGIASQISSIAAEVGGAIEGAPVEGQIELYDALIEGCQEAVKGEAIDPKGPLLDFFGVPVKANDMISRVEELQHLAKRISRCEDPISQFRVKYLKQSNWSKGCGWNQIDDARLLLGVYYHGFGNWEKIRLDESLGLTKKIAPVELQTHETFLPRAPNLKDRASALLEMETFADAGKKSNAKARNKSSKHPDHFQNQPKPRGRGRVGRSNSPKLATRAGNNRSRRNQNAEPLVKEEGEMSGNEEVSKQFKEVKWMEWCQDIMADEKKTFERLQKLQTTSADLPKEKVLSKIRKYLQHIGRRIDQIVDEHGQEPHKQDRMMTRLWKHVSTFSNLTGDRLYQIYSKLKQEQEEEAGVGPSHLNGSNELQRQSTRLKGQKNNNSYQTAEPDFKIHDPAKFEAWKRRKRAETDAFLEAQGPFQRPVNSAPRLPPSKEMGILGAAPSDSKPFKIRQGAPQPRQGFSSSIR
ncbi:protein CHROMATIN REMODELING 5 [Silene latifolia]|uniref:protein CHROMATIN REMODELING 5 n=1 Tax=Silene latifolia TaxID=37657 RepID=UPI003D788434